MLFPHAMHGGGVVKKHLLLYGAFVCVIVWWCLVIVQLQQMYSYWVEKQHINETCHTCITNISKCNIHLDDLPFICFVTKVFTFMTCHLYALYHILLGDLYKITLERSFLVYFCKCLK
jgi:hypothetical protein